MGRALGRHEKPSGARTRRRWFARPAAFLATLVLAAAAVVVPGSAAFAATVNLNKSAVNVPAGGVGPGGSFQWSISASCSSLDEACEGFTLTDTLGPEFTANIVEGTYTWSGGPDTEPSGGTTFDSVAGYAYTYSYDASTGGFSLTIDSVPGGQQVNIQLPMTLPPTTELPDGTVVTNTACVEATNAAQVCNSGSVTTNVPTTPGVTGSKSWEDGSAIAGSGETSTVTLGVQNNSSGEPQGTGLQVSDQTNGDPATDPWNYFDLTGFGAVTYPPNAGVVQIRYCELPYPTACGPSDWTVGALQSGNPLVPDAGIDLANVTGVEFLFLSPDNTPIPNDAAGSVEFEFTLRDTERDSGEPFEPSSTVTLTNSAIPGVIDTEATTTGDPASDTYQVVPNIPDVDVAKSWFSDTDANWQPDGSDAHAQENWPVSSTVDATNSSPFAVESITVREPNDIDAPNGLDYMNLDTVRFRFPDGAIIASGQLTCTDGTVVDIDLTAPPTEVLWTVPDDFPCAQVASIEITYTSPAGTSAIAPGASAGLDVHGDLNQDAGVGLLTNCAGADVTNSGSGAGSATGQGCANLDVATSVNPGSGGTKTVSQTSLPPDTPITYTINFANTGNFPLWDLHLAEPANLTVTEDTQPFVYARITSIQAQCTGGVDTEIVLYLPSGDPAFPTEVPLADATPEQIDAARGFDVHVIGTLPVGASCRIQVEVERREDTPNGVVLSNCFIAINDGAPVTDDPGTSTGCSADVTTGPPSSSADLQKVIEPGSVARPVPGLTPQLGTVKLRVANTGNTHLSTLSVTDFDDDGAGSDFFRAFDFVSFRGVSFPPGANVVQVDVCTTGCADGVWIEGTPTSSTTPGIPAGVAAAEVRGVQVTFSSNDPAHGGFNLVPGSNFPSTGACPQASVCFTVTPRATDRDTGEEILGSYENTATGGGTAQDQLGGGFTIPGVVDDLAVVEGAPALEVGKQVIGSANLAPGAVATFELTVTSTGTDALVDMLVSDPIPDGLVFAENGVGGQPYQIVSFTTPDGTTAPLPEDFVAERDTDGTVTRLVWTFPGDTPPNSTVVIRIGMRLAGGVEAGTVVTNTVGAGSAVTGDLSCTDPSNGVVSGDPFAADLNCTADATVVTSAGAAFDARKWVSGNPELGLYVSTTGEFVTIDDPQCPALTKDGITYTSAPCVALAYPGEDYRYLARLVNAGTYVAPSVRFLDELPEPDDTGVIDTSDRGTEWDVAPTLIDPPVVEVSDGSTPAVSLGYTDAEEPCLDDLNGGSCAGGSWDGQIEATDESFEALLSYDTGGLAPGAQVDITWSMSSPADPGVEGYPSIAWNSFAHAETVATPGEDTALPAAEPAKVGIGLVFGGIQVNKVVQADPGVPVPDGAYTIAYACTVTTASGDGVVVREGTAQFAPDQPWSLTGIPANAECAVRETDARGGVSSNPEATPLTVTVPWSTDPVATGGVGTITNTFGTTSGGGGEDPGDPGSGSGTTTVGGRLPWTGAEVGGALAAVALLLGGGAALVTLRRRRL